MKRLLNFLKRTSPTRLKKLYHWIKTNFDGFYAKGRFKIPTVVSKGIYSQHGQDVYLKYIIEKYPSITTLVEVGCNHPVYNNNTFLFKDDLNIISIDPIDYSEQYKEFRDKTKFLNYAVSNYEGISDFFIVTKIFGWEDQMSGFTEPDERFNYIKKRVEVKTLNTILSPLKDLFEENNDYGLLLDIEGNEKNALEPVFQNNNNLKKPLFILTECSIWNNNLINYITFNGYKLKAKIGGTDLLFVKEEKE